MVPPWRVRVTGRELLDPARPYIFVANHQSLFDILALFWLRRQFKWVAKDSLFAIPFLGWAMSAAGYIRLVRGRPSSIRASYDEARRWLTRRMSVCFFPEGTRSVTGQTGPFKNGAFKLSMETGVPVVPIAIAGTRELLQRGGWRVALQGRVEVRILPPVEPAPYYPDGADRFRDDVRAQVLAALTASRGMR
jgi:1-acyl-sn-glycerol-3-phosphate acyltransferase